MNQVTEVSIKKQGTGAKGPWTMYAIKLDDGRKASGFDLIKVGDYAEVEPTPDGKYLNYRQCEKPVNAAPIAPQSPPQSANGQDDIQSAREHIMKAANLYNLCVDAADKAVAPWLPEVARTGEQFQATVASLFIEASRRITNDGVNWWSYIDKMPSTPIKK